MPTTARLFRKRNFVGTALPKTKEILEKKIRKKRKDG
jgi:hypothetical protein